MRKTELAGILLALLVLAGSLALNFPGAWDGGRAGLGQLAVTVIYVGFWAGFSVVFRRSPLLVWVCFGVALLTFLGCLSALVPIDFVPASLIQILFAGVPLYGLRFFMGWAGLYTAAGAASAAWGAWALCMTRKGRGDRKQS